MKWAINPIFTTKMSRALGHFRTMVHGALPLVTFIKREIYTSNRNHIMFSSLAKSGLLTSRYTAISRRLLSSPPMEAYEQKIYDILQEQFSPKKLDVRDVSGGCGSMFAILVESEKFKGIPMIKQHRLVNEVLKDEIAKWHGLQLRTKGV